MRKLLSIAAMMLLSIATGCQKGEKGDPGPAGRDGNANVIGTNTITIFPHNWVYDGSNAWHVSLTANEITSAVVGKGAVLVYYQGSNNVWIPLPFTLPNGVVISYGFAPGELTITLINAGSVNGNLNFRAVVIPANAKLNGININDYNSLISAGFKPMELRLR